MGEWIYSRVQGFYVEPKAGGKVQIFGIYNNKQTKKIKKSRTYTHSQKKKFSSRLGVEVGICGFCDNTQTNEQTHTRTRCRSVCDCSLRNRVRFFSTCRYYKYSHPHYLRTSNLSDSSCSTAFFLPARIYRCSANTTPVMDNPASCITSNICLPGRVSTFNPRYPCQPDQS